MNSIEHIEDQLKELQLQLGKHELYNVLNTLDDVQLFMEDHVFAVWDFMSLLKALQQQLTCVSVPWLPVENSVTARFINEIVHGEETDINELGIPKSHFEMYMDAMKEVNADTSIMMKFLSHVSNIDSVARGLQNLNISVKTKEFVNFTFDVIKTKKPHIIAASFTFGREDIIPEMFLEIVKKAEAQNNKKYTKLNYYLNRHIELDGDEHGPLSLQMIQELCGDDDDKWNEVLFYAKESMRKRIKLWDGITEKIKNAVAV